MILSFQYRRASHRPLRCEPLSLFITPKDQDLQQKEYCGVGLMRMYFECLSDMEKEQKYIYQTKGLVNIIR